MTGFDDGARCDRHVGEVFPPRCGDCTAATDERAPAGAELGAAVDAIAADLRWLTYDDPDRPRPRDVHDFDTRVSELFRTLRQVETPGDVRAAVFTARETVDSAVYAELVTRSALMAWTGWALQAADDASAERFDRLFSAARGVYRLTRGPERARQIAFASAALRGGETSEARENVISLDGADGRAVDAEGARSEDPTLTDAAGCGEEVSDV